MPRLLFCMLCFVGLSGPLTIGISEEEPPPTKEQPPLTEEKKPPLTKEEICQRVLIAEVVNVIDYASGQPVVIETKTESKTPEPKDLSPMDVRAASIALGRNRPMISTFVLSFHKGWQRSGLRIRLVIPKAFIDEAQKKQPKENQEPPIRL